MCSVLSLWAFLLCLFSVSECVSNRNKVKPKKLQTKFNIVAGRSEVKAYMISNGKIHIPTYVVKICYQAKTCIHSGKERCGVDGKGNQRRFYDSCDLLEYNCLQGTDYVKATADNCQNLPPIDPIEDNKVSLKGEEPGDKISKEKLIEGETPS